jgi:hypothetical protein
VDQIEIRSAWSRLHLVAPALKVSATKVRHPPLTHATAKLSNAMLRLTHEVAVNDNAVEAVVNEQQQVAERGEKFHGKHPHQAWTGQAHGGRQELSSRR